jgi:glycosyltransferase involved in cell wall biosynthesis
MPIYNGIEYINDSVPSIIGQTYDKWELIIGINGHDRNSDIYKIAKIWENKDSRIKVYDMFDVKGKSNALNRMLHYCSYDWVSLLDVDDIWLKDKLQSQTQYMENYDVIGTHCRYFGDLNISPSIPLGNISCINFFKVNPIINSSCLLKKSLCYWNSKWDGIEDYDLWIRLWKNGHKFFNVESIQILHRIHNDSAFNSNGNSNIVPNLILHHR